MKYSEFNQSLIDIKTVMKKTNIKFLNNGVINPLL